MGSTILITDEFRKSCTGNVNSDNESLILRAGTVSCCKVCTFVPPDILNTYEVTLPTQN